MMNMPFTLRGSAMMNMPLTVLQQALTLRGSAMMNMPLTVFQQALPNEAAGMDPSSSALQYLTGETVSHQLLQFKALQVPRL